MWSFSSQASIQFLHAPAGGTRTCIHTPGAPLDPAELALPCARVRTALDGAALVYFDGRLAEAAVLLAAAARERGIPIIVEGERLRPGLDDLLAGADYVTTSAKFPQVRTVLESQGLKASSRVWPGRLRCCQQPRVIGAFPVS